MLFCQLGDGLLIVRIIDSFKSPQVNVGIDLLLNKSSGSVYIESVSKIRGSLIGLILAGLSLSIDTQSF